MKFILFLCFTFIISLNMVAKAEDNIVINNNISFYTTGFKQWYLDEGEQPIGQVVISGYTANKNNKFAIKIPSDFPIIFSNISTGELNGVSTSLTYSNDRKIVYFYSSEAKIELDDLKVKIYDQNANNNNFLLDINNDNVFDARDTNTMSIDDNDDRNKNDNLKPEKINDLKTEMTSEGIKFTWLPIVDLDVRDLFVQKKVNDKVNQELFWNHKDLNYTDKEVKNGDKVEYLIYARDYYYWGEANEIKIDKVELPEVLTNNNADTTNKEEVTNSENTDNKTITSNNPKTILVDRAAIKTKAEIIMHTKNPLARIKLVREEMKKLTPKNKVWLMRYVLAYKNK